MSPAVAAPVDASAPKVYTRCRFCTCALGLDDDSRTGVCLDCATRPDVKRAIAKGASSQASSAAPAPATPPPAQKRPFSVAEKSLIKNMHHILPPADLLRILNDRLVADVGAGVPLWTLEQLHAETSTLQQAERAADWTGLREILRVARSCGVLEQITPQVIDDFAVCFQLSSAQVINVRDVIRGAKEGA